MSNEERSLADAAEAQDEPKVVDASLAEVSVEDFDVDAFLDGVRPTRRAVKLYQRADLVGPLEERVQELETAGEDPEQDEQVKALYAQFHASGKWFTVEKRSSEWERKFRKDTARALDITLDDDGNVSNAEDGLTLSLAQAAAQTIIPSGVTTEKLRKFWNTNQNEVAKLFMAVQLANQQTAEQSRVVAPDFSRKPSTKNGTAGS